MILSRHDSVAICISFVLKVSASLICDNWRFFAIFGGMIFHSKGFLGGVADGRGGRSAAAKAQEARNERLTMSDWEPREAKPFNPNLRSQFYSTENSEEPLTGFFAIFGGMIFHSKGFLGGVADGRRGRSAASERQDARNERLTASDWEPTEAKPFKPNLGCQFYSTENSEEPLTGKTPPHSLGRPLPAPANTPMLCP